MPATVQAFDHHEHHHSSESSGGHGCGSSSTSSSSSTSPSSPQGPSADPTPTPSGHKRVFVTSTTYSGALGGLKAADAQCQYRAAAHGLVGVFRAWMSDTTSDAYARTADVGPWYTTRDALAFATKADLKSPPKSDLLDELGGAPAGPGAAGAWTGSDSAGAATGQDCGDWTNATVYVEATTGSTLALDPAWGGGNAPLRCDAKAPLICFEQ